MLRIQIIIWTIIISILFILGLFKNSSFFIVFAVIILFIFILHITKIKLTINKSITTYIPEFEDRYISMKNKIRFINSLSYVTKKEYSNIEKVIKDIYVNIYSLRIYIKYNSNKSLKDKIDEINKFIDNYKVLVDEINKNYFKIQLEEYGILFDSIEKYPLDVMQKKAILTPEENLLVIAWAWSWKTSTIVWKVKHLLEVRNVKQDEILLISFTSASAKEMNTRIKEKLSLDLDVMTFHKLWKNILEEVNNSRINILDDNQKSKFKEKVYTTLLSDIHDESPELFNKYFSYIINPAKYTFEFENIWEVIDYTKENNISTLKERVSRGTLQGEYLKSMEEVELANFLFLNGINYTYEKAYKIDTTNSKFWQYRPDFYLDDYDIYIEHYWIDRKWNVPKFFWDWIWWYYLANKKYNDGIIWKENLHKENNTKLVCTYSYENNEWVLFENLKKNLTKKWVKFSKLNKKEVIEKVMPSIRTEYSNFMDFVFTFLWLYKSNYMNLDNLYKKNDSLFKNEQRNLKAKIFIQIFEKVLKYYEENLKELNVIDFDDMINNSTSYINNDKIKTPYKYILIDEFQDIWIWRYKLVKSIIDKNNAELFCVWDDWQSIYRFTWWDLNIFTHFEKYFPFWEQVFINKTYRYPQKVNDVTHEFITKNKAQINKILESWNKEEAEEPIFNIINYKDDEHKKELLNMVLLKYKKNIVALWRYTSEKKVVPKGVDFMTIHWSKWLEADYIVILNWNKWRKWSMWFPSKKKDNSLLDLVLSEPDNYEYSEERRLFYVALTRAKKKTFILTKEWNKSPFIEELEEILGEKAVEGKENKTICPRCKKWNLVPRENFAKWALWCTNYPSCDYTIKTISPIKRHKWLPLSKLDDKWLNWILNKFANDKIMQYSVYYELERRKK